jgi:hypothetical protein
MIIDRDNMFSNEKAITASGASDAIDLGAAGDALGQELTFHAIVGTDFKGLTSLAVKIQTSDDNNTWTDSVSGPAVPLAELVAGKDVFCVRVPQGLKRYVRLYYTVAGSATAGTITSFMSKDL